MITKVMTKSSKVNQRMSSRCSRKNEFKMFKIESRILQDSRIKLPRIKIKIQDSRFKNQEKT